MLDNQKIFRSLYLIRRFEETVLNEFPRGRFYGTTHTYMGQEADAVGVLSHILPNDIVVSNHRCHGHFLAYGGGMRTLFAELMGKATGVCGGRGGSQHLHWQNFYSNGILGGTIPIATGMALAEKAPILFVVENNRIAQTTPIELSLAGDIVERFTAFGIQSHQLQTSDVLEILPVAEELLVEIRKKSVPRALILNTNRFGPHSKGDDARDPEAINRMRQEHDPIKIHGSRLDPDARGKIEADVEAEVERAFQKAISDPLPTINSPSLSR
jgi:TPP-dependent pyruvate/acetoin dehydrogenase alpha subunit